MASNNSIVKKSIQIDAGDTVRTVRSLKQEISDLRDQLLNLEQGTEEYDAVQKQLAEDVEDLNTVMGAHKDKAEVLEGSYNDLQNQLKELKKAWKETNDEADRDVLGQKINELNNQLKEMDASIGDFHRNVGNYESAWNGLTGVMEKSEKITDDLGKGIRAFGTAMGLTDNQVKALSDGLKKLKDAFNIAKDITKAQEETTKLSAAEKAATVQGAALATTQKTTGVAAKSMAAGETTATVATKGLSVAMKGLKAALISTGIGALIVLLGQLSGQLDKIRDKIKKTRDEGKSLSLEFSELAVDYASNVNSGLKEKLDYDLRVMEAEGKKEMEILEARVKGYEEIRDRLREEQKKIEENIAIREKYIEQQEKQLTGLKAALPVIGTIIDGLGLGASGKIKDATEELDNYKKALENVNGLLKENNKDWGKALQDIEIQKIKDARKEIEGTTEELRKWTDLVKDKKFSQAWHDLFNIEFTGANPSDILKSKMDAAIALVERFKGETTEVEQYFKQLIAEADAAWQSLVDKEQQIFEEGLNPAERLEKEKNEWIQKANEWGFNAIEITRYYNKKIQEEQDKAEKERKAKQEAADAERLAAIETYLEQVDAALQTQEKMDALFNPMFVQDTAAGDIEQDIEAVQRLYDTQMEYLNGLLESADLTEEAYAGIEERILSLTIAFNSQMTVLKKEMDYQGKNWTALSRKGVASFQLMENAATDFADVFQQVGLENSIAFKAFATAQALISSFLAANRVLAEEPGPFYMKAIAAAAALAAGIANVVAIWAVDPAGSNAGSMATQQQATPVIGDSQPINYTRNITSAEEEDEMNQPIYVTVTDIEDGINGRRAQVTNSSF